MVIEIMSAGIADWDMVDANLIKTISKQFEGIVTKKGHGVCITH